MNENGNRIDELFRKKLEQFAPLPPPEVWEKIDSGIAERKRRPVIVWRRWFAVAAVLLLACVTALLFYDTGEKAIPRAGEDQATTKSVTMPEAVTAEIPPVQGSSAVEVPAGLHTETLPGASGRGEITPVFTAGSSVEIPRDKSDIMEIQSLPASLKPVLSFTGLAEIRNRNYDFKIKEEKETSLAMTEPGRRDQGSGEWEIGVRLSPSVSSYTSGHSADYARNMTKSDMTPMPDMGGGFAIGYAPSGKWRIESGIYYSKVSDKSENSWLPGYSNGRVDFLSGATLKYFNTEVTLDQGYIDMNGTAGVIRFSKSPGSADLVTTPESALGVNSTVLSSAEFRQIFDFMEIPFSLRYKFLDRRVDVEIFSGISTSLLIGNNVFMENSAGRERVGTTRDISTLNFSGLAGFSLTYPLGKNLSLSVEPRGSYYLNSLNKSSDVNFRPWKIGLFTGINYHF